MKAWLIQIGEPLPIDGANERLMRTGMLAQALVSRGHEVHWWASSFDHARLRQRPQHSSTVQLSDRFAITLLEGRSYPRAVSVARIRNHREVAADFESRAPDHGQT